MATKYSINELVEELGVTRTAVNRKIEKYGFEIFQDYVNGRKLKLVELTDEQLEALKQEIGFYKEINDQESSDTRLSIPGISLKNVDLINKLMEHHEKVLKEVRYFADKMIENERTNIKLLQDSEKLKSIECSQIKNENKQLKVQINSLEEKIQDLETELSKKKVPFWKKKFFKG